MNAEKEFMVDFFGLEPGEIEDISYTRQSDKRPVLRVILTNDHDPCPDCGCPHPRVKEYIPKKIKYADGTGRDCILLYHARRFKCPACHRTYYEPSPFVQKKGKIADKVVFDILKDLKDYNQTFASVGRKYCVSATTVSNIFDAHVEIPRKKLPSLLCIDEVYAMKTQGSKYVCLLLDFEKQTPVDLLPNRWLPSLLEYMSLIPEEERLGVKAVCFDMYPAYRKMVKACFPNAIGVVDRFHVMQEFTRRLTKVRIRVMNRTRARRERLKEEMKAVESDFPRERYRDDPCWQRISADWQKTSDQYYVLKHFHWLLSKDEDLDIFDPGREGQYNRHFQKYMTLLQLREILLGIDPELEEAVRLKRVLTHMYESGTYDKAGEQLFNETYVAFRNSSIKEMNGFSRTMKEWRDEIFNSFNTVTVEYMVSRRSEYTIKSVRLHNGIIENRNKMIKCMKHNSYGFTNWVRFRNRVMYVLDPKATYSLESRFGCKAVKKKKNK